MTQIFIPRQLEEEIKEFLDNYWKLYLEGDLQTWSTCLTDDYKNIGGTEEEIWNSKKEILDYTMAIIDQTVGIVEFRNKKTEVFSLEPYVLAHEFFDMYIKIENDWVFYGKFRCSSIIQRGKAGWQVIHQHGSYPDSKTEQGEAYAFDKINVENRELKDAIKRRTVELENKTRDLEVESSLERVRAQALSMRKPDDLPGICEVLFTELLTLGFAGIRNAMINIHDDEKGSFLNYDFSESAGASVTTILYNSHPATENLVRQVRLATDAFAEVIIDGNELDEWREYRKSMGEQDDPKLNNIGQLSYYFFSIGTGAIGISTYYPITEEKRNVLKRFRNVFELAYRRYIDVAQAEAQAREARIELALERVRARTMAMQKSDELGETAFLLFQQFQELGETPDQITIGIIKEEAGLIEFWITINGNQIDRNVVASVEEPHLMNKLFVAWKANERSSVINLSGKELKEFISYRKDISRHIETPSPRQYSENRRAVHSAFFSKGFITFSSADPKPTETLRLLERFAGVFDQTYTRFLDLQKAETQAREAQLEAALEKVRSRSLAMQNSDELREVVAVVFEKFQELKFSIDGAAFIATFIEGTRAYNCWLASDLDQPYPTILKLPQYDTPTQNDVWLATESGLDFFSKTYSIEEKNHWLSYAFEHTDLKIISDEFKNWMLEQSYLTQSFAVGKNSLIGIHFHHQRTLSETEVDILKRFAKVFDQAYIRFLDLQKAEAQVREAQIEAGLERFRSRMLGMQKSSELEETTTVMHQQMSALGIVPEGAMVSIVLIDKKTDTAIQWIVSDSKLVRPPEGELRMPMNEHPQLIKTYEAWKRKEPLLIRDISGEEKEDLRNYFLSLPSFQNLKSEINQWPERLVWSEASFSNGTLCLIYTAPLQQPTLDILVRFSKVFDLTYTRFLDIQKAEEQAREAQIQLALERVRARTMAMQRSDEMAETAAILFEQFIALGELPERMAIEIVNEAEHVFEIWATEHGGKQFNSVIKTSLDEPIVMQKMYRAWKEQNKSITIDLQGNELEVYFQFLKKMKLPVDRKIFGKRRVQNVATFSKGILTIITPEPRPRETIDILERFAAVFDGTYTRFLDLQKAETQAREAEIELALERVRARTMAMQRSDELAEASFLLDSQVRALGIETRGCAFNIYGENESTEWFSSEMGTMPVYKTPREDFFLRYFEEGKTGKSMYIESFKGDACAIHYDYLCSLPVMGEALKKIKESGGSFPEQQTDHVTYFKYGYLLFITLQPVPDAYDIFLRFAKVFEQTYTRFLDLQKAEAQAREAQIEAALERVRSRSLAMHKSDELQEVVNTVHASLVDLGVKMDSANFNILYEGSRDMDLWIANIYSQRIHVPYLDLKPVRDMMDARDQGITSLQVACTQEQKNLFWKEAFETTGFSVASSERKKFILESKCWTVLWALAKHCGIQLNSYSRDSFTEEEVEITKRFANVFEQAYVRFLDLQRAEDQAREAIIEAALERVRSKTMAMHNSEDVGETVSTMLDELVKLGVETNRCGILIYSDSMTAEVWTAKSNPEGKATLTMGHLDLEVHPLLSGLYKAWKNKEPLFTYTMVGEDLIAYYKAINETKYYPVSFEINSLPKKEFHSDFYFAEGSIFAFTAEPIPSAAKIIFKRFAGVFGQTYRRYLDLQKSEANTIEAVRRSSLDRVRAETASMRTKNDLERITPLIWNELTTLGVPFTRCGVFIMDQQYEQIHTFLSTPDGRAIAAFHLPYNTAQTTFQNLVEYWQKKEIYKEHWDEAAFVNWTRNLVKSGAIAPTEKYVTEHHLTNLYLHFLPFLQGMLYVGNDAPLNEDDLHLVQNLADAFSNAYARYEDFNRLESAKAQIEITLVDLKQAQAQLVQAEKMASLGELTAGIAHEIQNPLNFVNNFSEVSNELIDEMKDELEAGNLQLATEIAEDVKQNLQKINHHGKRADAIVKGMLQHSRTSSGVKEPTDINALADEYLRLAYHGLRAKDKSFNATLKTDFDPTIGKINIIPQDIGRVMLNLITNAFHAVGTGRDLSLPHYVPTVCVSTKNVGDHIEISVRDNGSGIPSHILDKIFQPFFTTKPTGQGTGLGLSMSYDIVKAHGGELKVETKEGEGSEFILLLTSDLQ